MIVTSIVNAEHYIWGEGCDGWHLAKSPNLSVIQERVPPGASEVHHYHQCSEQFFYVLAGIASVYIDDNRFQIEPGHGLHIPAGVIHQLRNEQEVDLEFLVISTPPSHNDRVI